MEKIFPTHFCICPRKIYKIRATTQYFAGKCICGIKKHSKSNVAMCCGCERDVNMCQPTEHTWNIFITMVELVLMEILSRENVTLVSFLAVHNFFLCGHGSPFHSRISGRLNCLLHTLCRLCYLVVMHVQDQNVQISFYLTDRFYSNVHLYCDRSQMTSCMAQDKVKCSDFLFFACNDLFCDLIQHRSTKNETCLFCTI